MGVGRQEKYLWKRSGNIGNAVGGRRGGGGARRACRRRARFDFYGVAGAASDDPKPL